MRATLARRAGKEVSEPEGNSKERFSPKERCSENNSKPIQDSRHTAKFAASFSSRQLVRPDRFHLFFELAEGIDGGSSSHFDHAGGYSESDCTIGYVMHDNRSRPHNGPFPDPHPVEHDDAKTQPGAVFDGDASLRANRLSRTSCPGSMP